MKEKFLAWAAKNKANLTTVLYLEAIYWTGVILGGRAGYLMGKNALIKRIAKCIGDNSTGSVIFNPKTKTLSVKRGYDGKCKTISDEMLTKWSNAVVDAMNRGVSSEELNKMINEIIYKIEHGVNNNE